MAKQTIKLKLYNNIVNEYVAAGTITPGMLVKVDSAGTLVAHNVAGGLGEKMFATEDELQGKTIADNYSAGNPVQTIIANSGDEVLAIIADGQNISVGDFLVSNGDGKLKEMTPDASGVVVEQYPIAVALEAKDMTGSAGVDPSPRIAVRII
jgi:hypothetical protein